MKWIKRLALLLIVGALVWLFRVYPLRALGSFLVVEDAPKQAQAIVVLAGESPARVLKAYDLAKEGWSSKIILSRGPRSHAEELLSLRKIKFMSPADVDRQILIQLGIPEDRVVILENSVASTVDEAEAVKDYFEGRSVQCILLVTSRFHSRRAKAVFEDVFKNRIDVLSVPTVYDEFNPRNWWHRHINVKHTFIEYQKLIYYTWIRILDFLHEVGSFPEKTAEGEII